MAMDPKTLLAAVESALEGTLDDQASSYEINGRSIENISPTELLRIRAQLKGEIAMEEADSGAAVGEFREAN